ncbi:hypothetical protein YYC_02179 [Plasmodium yoelii 17X]|uniref:Early transcribed membrane protein n=1 Tax=Plasmodium yoelii 17X TaxID=1323249 RepID=V7PPC8_PLAYE|nr:hypothetical protein YYC_02179 [Plasmodium yoelii 17X]
MKTTYVSLFFIILLICGIFECKASSVDETNDPKPNNVKLADKINSIFKNKRNGKIAAIAASIAGSTIAIALALACMHPEVREKFRIRKRVKNFDDVNTPQDISLIPPVENPYQEYYPEDYQEQYPEISSDQYIEQPQKHYTKRFLEQYTNSVQNDHTYSYSPTEEKYNTYYMAPDTHDEYEKLFTDDQKEEINDNIVYHDELSDLMGEGHKIYSMNDKPFDPYI